MQRPFWYSAFEIDDKINNREIYAANLVLVMYETSQHTVEMVKSKTMFVNVLYVLF